MAKKLFIAQIPRLAHLKDSFKTFKMNITKTFLHNYFSSYYLFFDGKH